MFKPSRLLPALLLALCLPAHANWHLDGESSRLSFVTGKNGNIAEVNRLPGAAWQGRPQGRGRGQHRDGLDQQRHPTA
ncbi:hypothetical protein OKW51_002270 [Pseudomonas hunanensis]|nr:hypothetical protein [Pseudomonas hunanensis]